MKKGMNISLENNNKVVNVEENKKVAKKGYGYIVFTSTCVLSAIIIISSSLYANSKKNTEIKDNESIESTYDNNTIAIYSDIENSTSSNIETNEDEVEEIINNDKEIDYSNVETFYNHIIDNRNKYGSFAESFQSEDDIKNFINFLYKFDELYGDMDIDTTILTQDEYDKIIQDYYGSCVKYDVKGELNLLFNNNKLAQNKIAETEELAYDLKNGKGKDYTIANKYYTWFLENLIDDRTKVDFTTNNAPFIDGLREQFEQYRYSGNMLEARKYQKNDSLPVDSIHLYYADETPKDIEITEVENSFTCPDWGVDNIISKYEEDTETKLYIKRDNQGSFYRVDEQFEIVLNNGKVK